jgi:large subunit ribosomal protein L28
MARRCSLTGKGVLSGNNVSHANNRTRRRFLPNIQNVSFMSEVLGRAMQLKVATSTIRSIDQANGIDAYLLGTKDAKLTTDGVRLKRMISKAAAKKQAAAA